MNGGELYTSEIGQTGESFGQLQLTPILINSSRLAELKKPAAGFALSQFVKSSDCRLLNGARLNWQKLFTSQFLSSTLTISSRL